MIKKFLKSALDVLPHSMKQIVRNNFIDKVRSLSVKDHYKSYSQCGEDIIAQLYLSKQKGFYVDVGAFHPVKISNTNLFFKKGWNGINIDGTAKVIELFNKYRPNDINVHSCVGLNDGEEVTFYRFKSGALNTFKKDKLDDIKLYHHESPMEEEKIRMRSLGAILNEHVKEGQQIDLLSIDAEGADEDVLRSNDWVKFKPGVIIIENHSSITDFMTSNIYNFLTGYKYTLGGFSRHSFVFYCEESV